MKFRFFKKKDKLEENNETLMKIEAEKRADAKESKEMLGRIVERAEEMLVESGTVFPIEEHPIFSYVKIFTDYIQNRQAINLISNTRDNIEVESEFFNIVNAYFHPLNNIFYREISEKGKIYENLNLNVSNAKSPMITEIWNPDRILDNIKSIGKGMMYKRFLNIDEADEYLLNSSMKKENYFEFDEINHFAHYIYPLGITHVINGNHSIFSGMIKGEGHIKVDKVIDISYLYDDYYFDGTYITNSKTNEKEKIYFELGALFEIGRVLLKHSDIFPLEIHKCININKN